MPVNPFHNNAPIYTEIARLLADGQARSLGELLPHLPTLAALPQGEDVLRLLLRLHPCAQHLPDGRWTIAAAERSPEERIISAAQSYFQASSQPGVLIGALTQAVAQETGFAQDFIRTTLVAQFKNNAGRMVFSQRKEH
ncbi:MAG: hypothetical protein PHQ40_00835 [Anaerolineaceae bacterium]|nr:hypothetical protein [Anaerolineaceae bacterium]